jgi:hypothetical protein
MVRHRNKLILLGVLLAITAYAVYFRFFWEDPAVPNPTVERVTLPPGK